MSDSIEKVLTSTAAGFEATPVVCSHSAALCTCGKSKTCLITLIRMSLAAGDHSGLV